MIIVCPNNGCFFFAINFIKNYSINKGLLCLFFLLINSLLFFCAHSQNKNYDSLKRQGKFIQANNRYKLWTKKVGNGKIKIIILPGGPGSSHYPYLLLQKLIYLNSDIEKFFLDFVDCGFSDRTNDPKNWTTTNFTEDVEEIRKGLKLKDFYPFGHSFGAAVALEYLSTYPSNIKAAIISNNTYSFHKMYENAEKYFLNIQKHNTTVQELELQKANIKDTTSSAFLKIISMIDSISYAEHIKKQEVDTSSHIYKKYDVSSLNAADSILGNNTLLGSHLYTSNGTFDWDIKQKLTDNKVPTLIITGRDDYAATEQDLSYMSRNIGNSEYKICEGNHTLFISYGCFYDSILGFIKGVEKRNK